MGLSMFHGQNYNLLEGLQQRVSQPRLTEPAPDRTVLEQCYQAAFRVPDHAYLRPWRFLEISGEARLEAGQKIASALQSEQADMSELAYDKAAKCLLRAPLVVMVYASCTSHDKVPVWEQEVSVGCAAYAFSTALFSLGFGSVWRTGDAANSMAVAKAFGLSNNEKIIGFLYVGTPEKPGKIVQTLPTADFVKFYAGD